MKLKNIIHFGLLAILCASCSSDDDKKESSSRDVSFISQAKDFNAKNAQAGNQWTKGDTFGAFMLENGTFTAVGANSSNVIYTASASGTSVEFTSGSPLQMPEDNTKVDFMCYYPYRQNIIGHKCPVNLANQSEGTLAHDLMFSDPCTNYSKNSKLEVPITFRHQLAKLIFVFKKHDTQELVAPEKVIIKGMNTVATFDMESASLKEQSVQADMTPYKVGQNQFEAIVLPTIIEPSYEVEYIVDGATYSFILKDYNNVISNIEKGGKYTYTVSHINAEPPIVEVKVDFDGSLTPWNEGINGTGNAEFQINYKTLPLNKATNVQNDTYLKLTFEGAAPTIGNTGKIRIFRAEDNKLVDEIDIAEKQERLVRNAALTTKMDIIPGVDGRNRVINYIPIKIEGNTVIIKLHSNKLDFNTKYFVNIGSQVIKHADFYGIKNDSWSFTTKAAPAVPTDAAHTVTVGGDNSTADFRTIQAAMFFLSKNIGKDDQKTVYIQNGTYEELLFLRNVNNMTLKGESRDGVKILFDNHDDWNSGVGGSASIDINSPIGTVVTYEGGRALFLLESVDKMRFESLTIQNTHVKVGKGDQAEVIYANNDNKAFAFINCNVLSCQDTLNLKGFCWFYNSLVAGDVDFIWGSPSAALFEKCEIRSVDNGYVLQARVGQNNKGFVFLDCNLTTTGKATQMFLSRTANNGSFDNIAFINCKMDDIYPTFGWGLSGGANGSLSNPAIATLMNGYKTYNCTSLDGKVITIKSYLAAQAYTMTEAEYLDGYSKRSDILSTYKGNVSWFSE